MSTLPTLDEARGLFHANRLDEAVAACTRLVESGTDADEAMHVHAAVLLKQGHTDDALRLLAASIALHENASKLNTLAAVHLARHDGAAARAALERARALTGDDPRMWPNLGRALLLEGRVDEAAALLARTVQARPDWAPGWFVHGTMEAARGAMKAAAMAFDRAFELQPGFTDACHQAAVCWQAANRRDLARARWLTVLSLDAGRTAARAGLLEALPWPYETAEPAVVEVVEAALADRRFLLQPVCDALPAFLRGARPWQVMFRRAHAPDFTLTDDELRLVAGSSLVRRALTCGLITDLGMERVLCAWRRRFLEGLDGGEAALDMAAAVATHNALAGYAWPESEAETTALAGAPALARAMYRPETGDPRLGHLAKAAERERELAEGLPVLHPPPHDAVTRRYESLPYPRWETLDRTRRPQAVDDVLRALCPWAGALRAPQRAAGEPLRVLVAGCGTGRHALAVALRFRDAEVVALDASRAALGYAARKAETMGVRNVRFVVADIDALVPTDFAAPFHVVEAVGVIHHLADPPAGWTRLAALLAPQGFMKIGLYSRAGRAILDPARAIAGQSAPSDLRALRARLLAELPPEARVNLLQFTEFYTLAGLADLLAHPRERAYDLDEVEAELARLRLRFLGFENVPPSTVQALLERGGAAAGGDLAAWAALEREQPTTFRHMYQFWCQAEC